MPLLKHGRPVVDEWCVLAEGEPLPAEGRILVPFARLAAEAQALAGFKGSLGVRLEPAERVEALEPWLKHLALVALSFPVFGDGRAYSTARLLRRRYGFKGEIRAVGQVLVDQRQFMRQCGFDTFEVAEGRVLDAWRKAEVAMSLTYQPDYAGPEGAEAVWRARRRRQALAAE
jgi:uncharacterized protein (DUF934 family)